MEDRTYHLDNHIPAFSLGKFTEIRVEDNKVYLRFESNDKNYTQDDFDLDMQMVSKVLGGKYKSDK